MMTERQRLLTVLKGGEPDILPWYAELSQLYYAMGERGERPQKYDGDEGYLEFHKDLGAGVYCYSPFMFKPHHPQFTETRKDGYLYREYVTDIGSVDSKHKYMTESFCYARIKYFVESAEDMRVMQRVCEQTSYTDNYDEYKKIDVLWGGHGTPVSMFLGWVSPLQVMMAAWCGVQKTTEIIYDYPDEFDEFFKVASASQDAAFEIIANSPAEVVQFQENLSSEVTGRTLFQKYNAPLYKKRVNFLHKYGKKVGIHIDGTLKPCLGMLEECGFDYAEAVTPSPVGDVEPEDLRRLAGDTVIFGGLPGTIFSPVCSERSFSEHLDRVLNIFCTGKGYVLGVADQVPSDAIWERVAEVRRRLEKFY